MTDNGTITPGERFQRVEATVERIEAKLTRLTLLVAAVAGAVGLKELLRLLI